MTDTQSGTPNAPETISVLGAVCIGIGGMVGAGIFSVLGVVAGVAGNAMWLSFVVGGVIALLATYSYAKLGAKYPSAGGAVEFLVRGFGGGVLSGGINIFLWLSYVIALALYAHAFASYAATFLPHSTSPALHRALAVGVVLLFTLVNSVGAGAVGKSETYIVLVKVGILVLFAVVGMFFLRPELLSVTKWPGAMSILYGTGVIFIGYEGFGLVANAAANMRNPTKQLPLALYLSVFSVIAIYVGVSVAMLGNLPLPEIARYKDVALAAAAKPFLGQFGFTLIAIGAVLSTTSAINATLFGGANVSYMIARDGQLPAIYNRRVFANCYDGLLITAGLVILCVLLFNLTKVAMMGSSAFLLVYAAVNVAHLRLLRQTGANAVIVVLSIAACLGMFGLLSYYVYKTAPDAFWAMCILLAASFIGEWVYRGATGRTLRCSGGA